MTDSKVIQDVVKVYPDHMKIVIYHRGYKLQLSAQKSPQAESERANKKEDNLHRSLRRTKENFKDIILANRFEHFMTFTFDKSKHNRYDVNHCKSVMSSWLNRQRARHSPDLQYIIVPELHKDGAIHFHALVNNFRGQLNPVLNKKTGEQLKSKSGALVFDIPGYRAGKIRSALQLTDDYDAISAYMMKQYMTKDMPLIHGRRRYWCSQNLKRPEKHVNGVFKLGLKDVIKNQKPVYINDCLEVQIHKDIKVSDLKHTGRQISFIGIQQSTVEIPSSRRPDFASH